MADHAALIIPGGNGGPYVDVLDYAAAAVGARGGAIHRLWWDRVQKIRGADTVGGRMDGVRAQVLPALEAITATRPLIIAKSLGTYAVPIAVERALPAIWLTPVLSDAEMVAAFRPATAPFLLIGGTADPYWDGDAARDLTPHVLEVPGADHGMGVPGPLAASAAVLGRIATTIEEFLDRVVWPASAGR